jgi:uncharacterized membrane protein YgaE (UPF0421/DUF939 family)
VLTGLQLAIRAALASALCLWFALRFELEQPVLAMISAVLVTDLSPAQTRKLSLQRIAGTILGAGLGGLLSQVLGPGPVSVGLGVATAMFLAHVFRVPETAKVAGFVCGVVVLSYGEDPWGYAYYRLLETLLGIALAVLVSLVPKLIGVEPAEDTAASGSANGDA